MRPGIRRRWETGGLALAALALVGLTISLRRLAVDDAFVTYRYAANLARGLGFVYNPGERVLSTTAPLYGLLLSLPARLGLDLPLVGNVLGGLCIGAGAALLAAYALRQGQRTVAWLAGALYLLAPLLWLALGMETALLLALALAAFVADARDRPGWAGIWLGLATVTRYDAALLALLLFAWRAARRRRPPWRMALAGIAVAAPVLIFLTLSFGSPLPVTLFAKRGQTAVGVTGFFAGTSYLGGLGILLTGWLAQAPLYALSGLFLVAGFIRALRRQRWALVFVGWAVLHAAAYQWLGVAPYFWYYAPLVPATVLLLALGGAGLVETAGKLNPALRPPALVAASALLLFPPVWSLAGIARGLHAPLPEPNTALSKVLPEAKVDVYRRVGEWLAAETPAAATVGVSEVGVMGFSSDRPMVDFLGLIQPAAAAALARGDPAWTLQTYQPDYLALTAINPLYNLDPRGDAWFQAAYRPVQRFDDARFWGSPVVVYRRQAGFEPLPAAAPPSLLPFPVRFGDGLTLLAAEPLAASLQPGQPLAVRLWWRRDGPAPAEARVSAQLLGEHDRVLAQRDAAPGRGERPLSGWPTGKIVPDLALIGVPRAACPPDRAVLNLAVYDPASGERLAAVAADGSALGDSVRVGAFELQPGEDGESIAAFAGGVRLRAFILGPRAVSPGQVVELSLAWEMGSAEMAGVSVFVHLLDDRTGAKVAQADGPPVAADRRLLVVPEDAPPGLYHPLVGLYRPDAGARLPLLDAVGQTLGDALALCPLRIE